MMPAYHAFTTPHDYTMEQKSTKSPQTNMHQAHPAHPLLFPFIQIKFYLAAKDKALKIITLRHTFLR
jgi:hypothetical protein